MSGRELHRAERRAEMAKYTRTQLEAWGVVPQTYGPSALQQLFRPLIILDSLFTLQTAKRLSEEDKIAMKKSWKQLKEISDKYDIKLTWRK